MILKDPAEMALNDLHVALRKAADQYRHAADIAEDSRLSSLFKELAAERERLGVALEEQIRVIGLPRMPHNEREGLEKLMTTVKTTLSSDPRTTLLKDQEQLEQEIAQASTAALQENLSEPTRQCVHEIAEHVLQTQDRLSRFNQTLWPRNVSGFS